jgi:hypothetical protein
LEDSVIKRRIMLNRFGASSIGLFAAACLALACGSENAPEEPEDGAGGTGDIRPDPPINCDTNEFLEDCGGEDPPPPNAGGTGGGGNVTPPEKSQAELNKAAVENILKIECGNCHGSQLTSRHGAAA